MRLLLFACCLTFSSIAAFVPRPASSQPIFDGATVIDRAHAERAPGAQLGISRNVASARPAVLGHAHTGREPAAGGSPPSLDDDNDAPPRRLHARGKPFHFGETQQHLQRCRAFVEAEWRPGSSVEHFAWWHVNRQHQPPTPANPERLKAEAAEDLARTFPHHGELTWDSYVAMRRAEEAGNAEGPRTGPRPPSVPVFIQHLRQRWMTVHHHQRHEEFATRYRHEFETRARSSRSSTLPSDAGVEPAGSPRYNEDGVHEWWRQLSKRVRRHSYPYSHQSH